MLIDNYVSSRICTDFYDHLHRDSERLVCFFISHSIRYKVIFAGLAVLRIITLTSCEVSTRNHRTVNAKRQSHKHFIFAVMSTSNLYFVTMCINSTFSFSKSRQCKAFILNNSTLFNSFGNLFYIRIIN